MEHITDKWNTSRTQTHEITEQLKNTMAQAPACLSISFSFNKLGVEPHRLHSGRGCWSHCAFQTIPILPALY